MTNPPNSRRTFLDTLVRAGMAAGLLFLAGSLGKRSSREGDCRATDGCGHCGRYDHCGRPEADHYRLERARGAPQRKPGDEKER